MLNSTKLTDQRDKQLTVLQSYFSNYGNEGRIEAWKKWWKKPCVILTATAVDDVSQFGGGGGECSLPAFAMVWSVDCGHIAGHLRFFSLFQ